MSGQKSRRADRISPVVIRAQSPYHARMRLVSIIFALTLAVTVPAYAVTPDIDVIIRHIDELFRSSSSHATVEMQIVTPNWERTLTLEMWSLGTDRTFIRIHEPKKEKGVGTLRIGNEMWNYLPKVNKVIKVPPSMMTSSWMGSDFTNDDLVSEVSWVDDYDHSFVDTEAPKDGEVHIRSVPHEGVPVVWGSVVSAIRSDDFMPLWEKYYDEKDRLMRTITFSDVRAFGSRSIPTVLEIVPESDPGNKTVMNYISAEFDIAIEENIFSSRHLRSP